MDKIKCPVCGAVYKMTSYDSIGRDKDSYICEFCGKEVKRWNGGKDIMFDVISEPTVEEFKRN